jgi:hypothetical protein
MLALRRRATLSRAVRPWMRSSGRRHPELFSILEIYGADRGNNSIWIDHVNDWAAKGRVQRQNEDG